ncbi:MAG: 30S ribosomal protein S18 [Candidatus Levybacteria bacterium]|nr:30S ribosomal protein S18 [Candidatus Levybacteria bacterium]
MKKVIRKPRRKFTAPKVCYFCGEKKEPSFWEIGVLSKFLTERGKITPGSRNGLCLRHQRAVAVQIKYSRHLALMPFVSR